MYNFEGTEVCFQMFLSEKLPHFQSQRRPICVLPHGSRARDVRVLWRLTPWRPLPQERPGQTHWQAGPALPLISRGVHDFLEQDYYWDLEVSGQGQKGGWLVLPRGFQEGPSLLGFCQGPGPPPLTQSQGCGLFTVGTWKNVLFKSMGSGARPLGSHFGSPTSDLCVLE